MAAIDDIREAARKRLLFLPHAIRQMSRADRLISSNEVSKVVLAGELIEDHPTDPAQWSSDFRRRR